jgi:YD repeat-containing protein
MLDPSAGSPCGTSSPYCIELRLTNVPCSAPGSNVAFYISATPNTCPENATLSGTTCTCNTDFEENPAHNACIPKPVQQAEPEGTPGPQMCSAGLSTPKPILPATGEKLYTEPDSAGEGPHALNFVRTFRSRWSVSGAPGFAANPGLGQAWSHNHATSLVVEGTPPTAARVLFGDGSVSGFTWEASSASWKPASGSNSLVAITSAATGYLLTRAQDDTRWQFDAAGKLLSITERNGWVTTYSYHASGNGTGRLAQVTNAFGRVLSLAYDAAGQLSSTTTPDGQTISYTFDSALRLTGVGYPGNASKTYLYEDSRWPQSVTGIIDERGIRLATVVYDAQGRATESGYALGADRYTILYGATATDPVQVTDPPGHPAQLHLRHGAEQTGRHRGLAAFGLWR